MNKEDANKNPGSPDPDADSSNTRLLRLDLIKAILDFVSKCFYPAIALLLIGLMYPAISAIDLKGLMSRLQSAKAGDYEFAFSEALRVEGDKAAELNGTIEQLRLKVNELTQDLAALKKAMPAASLPPEQIAKREAKEAQFSNNAEYTVLIFYKPYQKEAATRIVKRLLSLGFKSSATPTDLKEAIKQFDENRAWVIYSEKGQQKIQDLKTVLPAATNERIDFVYRDSAYNLRSGDIQILLF